MTEWSSKSYHHCLDPMRPGDRAHLVFRMPDICFNRAFARDVAGAGCIAAQMSPAGEVKSDIWFGHAV